jgi:predicted AAA+ superfamily ATPase
MSFKSIGSLIQRQNLSYQVPLPQHCVGTVPVALVDLLILCYPTFQEFIHLKNRSHLMVEGTIKYNGKGIAYQLTNNIDELNKEFVNYLNFEDIPVVLSEKNTKRYGSLC